MSFLDRVNGQASQAGSGTFRPQLTSLIDVMTILLVFLIKSFSVEGNLVTPSPDLQLPLSTSQKPARPACALEVTRRSVIAEGTVLADLAGFAQADSLLVPPVFEWMTQKRLQCTDSLRSPEVLIQADRETEFNIIKRVMYSCSRAGFEEFTVLVLAGEQ